MLKLLAAAGQEAAQLVGCVNRYGQSAVHIGAHRGLGAWNRGRCAQKSEALPFDSAFTDHADTAPTSCLHAAARKGSPALLRSLVDAGGAAALLTADCEGKTAAEIARRNGNGARSVRPGSEC